MSLTRIQRGMIGPGAVVVPDNLYTTGTASSSTYLRGDGAWSIIPLGPIYNQNLNTTDDVTFRSIHTTEDATFRSIHINTGTRAYFTTTYVSSLLTYLDIYSDFLRIHSGTSIPRLFVTGTSYLTTIAGPLNTILGPSITDGNGKVLVTFNTATIPTFLPYPIIGEQIPPYDTTVTSQVIFSSDVVNFNGTATSLGSLYNTYVNIDGFLSIRGYGAGIGIGTSSYITSYGNNNQTVFGSSNGYKFITNHKDANSGFYIDYLKNNTTTSVVYYNPSSGEITYGPNTGGGGGGVTVTAGTSTHFVYYNTATGALTYGPNIGGGGANPFNQSLNTTDSVRFASVNIGGEMNIYASGNNVWFEGNPGYAHFSSHSVIFDAGAGIAPGQTLYADTIQANDVTKIVTINDPVVIHGSLTVTNIIVANTASLHLIGAPYGLSQAAGGYSGHGDPNAQITVASDLLPFRNKNGGIDYCLGSTNFPWSKLYVTSHSVEFVDIETDTTATLGISTSTLYVNGTPYIDQNLTTSSVALFQGLTINNYSLPASDGTATSAIVTDGTGSLSFQPAVLSANVFLDGGSANSVYNITDFSVDGGMANSTY